MTVTESELLKMESHEYLNVIKVHIVFILKYFNVLLVAIMIQPSMKNANWNISRKGKNSEKLEFLLRRDYRSFLQACRQVVSQGVTSMEATCNISQK